nr:hypothetical protein [Micromonospora sp. DSM 115978]
MTTNRDPRTMSREKLVAYFDRGGDISELLRAADPASSARRSTSSSPATPPKRPEPPTTPCQHQPDPRQPHVTYRSW